MIIPNGRYLRFRAHLSFRLLLINPAVGFDKQRSNKYVFLLPAAEFHKASNIYLVVLFRNSSMVHCREISGNVTFGSGVGLLKVQRH